MSSLSNPLFHPSFQNLISLLFLSSSLNRYSEQKNCLFAQVIVSALKLSEMHFYEGIKESQRSFETLLWNPMRSNSNEKRSLDSFLSCDIIFLIDKSLSYLLTLGSLVFRISTLIPFYSAFALTLNFVTILNESFYLARASEFSSRTFLPCSLIVWHFWAWSDES